MAAPLLAVLPIAGCSQARPAGDAVGVTLTAAPRWGRSTPGGWTPYLVTVRNEGLGDVEGEVVLVAETRPPPPPPIIRGGSAPLLSLDDVPPVPGTVVTLGQTELTSPRRPGPPPAPRDFPTYHARVALAGGGAQKTVTVPVVEAPYGYRAELRDGAGRRTARSPAAPREAGDTVALLSRGSASEVVLARLRELSGSRSAAVTLLTAARQVPDRPLLLSGLHAIVIDDFDTTSLSRSQVRSLQDFVALGGSLVLAGGAAGARTLPALPEQLTPLRPSGTATASLAALGDLGGATTGATATVVTGELRHGRSLVQADGGVPLVVQAEYGAGRVVQLAYDPSAEPLVSDPLLRGLAWDQGLARALARFGRRASGTSPGVVPTEQLWAPTLRSAAWPPWPRWGLGLLAAYAVLAGPVVYGVLRARRRPVRVWAVVPITASVVAVATGVAGQARHGPLHPMVELTTVGPDGAAMRSTYGGVQALGRGERRVEVPAGTGASTVFAQPALATASAGSELVHRGAGGGQVAQAGGGGEIRLPTAPGQVETFQLLSIGHRAGLESHLGLVGSGPPERGGLRVTGTVANHSSRPVRSLRAQLPEGAQARLADVIRPGRTIRVDAAFVWARGGPAGSGLRAEPEEMVMFAAANKAFTRSGQVVVVGLDPGSGASNKTSVVAEVVPLEGSENLVAFAESSHLVTSVGTIGARVEVHELGGLPGLGPLNLVFNHFLPPPEVYDWVRRTWRRLPSEGRPDVGFIPAPLADSEVDRGLVRIRGREDDTAAYQLELRGQARGR